MLLLRHSLILVHQKIRENFSQMKIKGFVASMMGVIPFYEFQPSLIGYHLPFNEFEIGILSHLLITHSLVHPVRWVLIKVFQHWSEYTRKKPNVTLFVHLFKV